MNKILVSLLILLFSINGISQDKIYLTDNSVISAKVIEVSINEVKYKKADNLTGPDYILPKSQIALIVYENGTHEVMNVVKKEENEEVKTDILPYYSIGKNLIGINYFDLVYKNVSLFYTRYLLNNHFSITLNSSIGFTNNDNSYSSGTSFLNFDKDYFHLLTAINYFPAGMQKISYFTGLTFMTGYGGDYTYEYYYPSQLVNKNYYGFYVNNGVQFNLTKHFNMRTSLALGLVDRDMNGVFQTHALFEIAAGIRF